MSDDWITTQKAAELSGYHPIYLLELLKSGKVKARKFGTIWQVDRASLLAYVKSAEKSSDKRRGAKKHS
jgi:excisionase family DNA binding protein